MHDWNHDGKIDLRDRLIQDEIESRNTGGGSGRSSGGGSGGGCVMILLIPIFILFVYAIAENAPSGVFSFIFFLIAIAVLLGGLLS
jgi:hypothetical protein